MMKFLTFFFITFLFSACSFKKAENSWQYTAANNFKNYQESFLKGNDSLAKASLKRAVQNAKVSSDFTTLAKVYLGKCALNISVGIEDGCEEYLKISNLLDSKELSSYYALLQRDIKESEMEFLASEYREFAEALMSKDYKSANEEVLGMKRLTASMLSLSLIKENAESKSLDYLLEKASFSGYKRVVLFYMAEKLKQINNDKERKILEKKIDILNTKE